MGLTVTWLHLSDLHACQARTGWDAHRIVKDLLKDLKHMQDRHGLRPDLIFFTGDAAFGNIGSGPGEKLAEQFGEVAGFLEKVRTVFEPEVPRENIFLVPGNHDVARDLVTPDQTEWLDSKANADRVADLISAGGVQWRRYMERLEEYRKFLEANGYSHLLTDPLRLAYCVIREVNGLSIGVAGLNSVWSSGRDGEKGKLWMGGRFQIGRLEPGLEDAKLRMRLPTIPSTGSVRRKTLTSNNASRGASTSTCTATSIKGGLMPTWTATRASPRPLAMTARIQVRRPATISCGFTSMTPKVRSGSESIDERVQAVGVP